MRVDTYTASIYCGLKEGYDGKPHMGAEAGRICGGYCDNAGLCVTVTDTHFIYTNGSERGVIVGLINYPRFPSTPATIRAHALKLGELLKEGLGQKRITIVFPDETVMLGEK